MRTDSQARMLAALALALVGCGVLLPPGGPPTRAPVFAVMHRFGCLGPCEDYELTVYADGVVEYQGNANVYVRGKRTTSIGVAGVELLRRRFADADSRVPGRLRGRAVGARLDRGRARSAREQQALGGIPVAP